jgi:hypothetical protein
VRRSASAWRDIAVDAAASLLPPAVIIVAPLNDIVFRNVRDLQYHPHLMRTFLVAAAALWIAGIVVLRLARHRWPARLWLSIPWAMLLWDALGGVLERSDRSLDVITFVDALVAVLLVAVVLRMRAAPLRRVAAAAGLVLMLQGLTQQAIAARGLTDGEVVGTNRTPARVRTPDARAPGNVYHLLLDAYQSESFADSTQASAAMKFPGFTYYTRFNTNFPRTASSEVALIHGRAPRPGLAVARWAELALAEGFWHDLANADAGVWVYPYGRWLCPPSAVKCVSSADLARDAGSTTTRDETVRLWATRLVPLSIRRRLQPVERAPATSGALPLQYFNLKQFDELLADEEHRPAHGQYIYYHALIPHHDHIMNERCELVESKWDAEGYWGHVACANLMIERLVETLRRLNRLDDALIIVHADHGAPEFLVGPGGFGRADDFPLDNLARRYQAVDRTYQDGGRFEQQITLGDSARWRSMAVEVFSSGLLLVKVPRGRIYNEDASAVQLLDIAPTVLTHFGLDTTAYAGVPLGHAPRDREQVFYAHSRSFDGKLSKYRLTDEGWKFVEDIPVDSAADD